MRMHWTKTLASIGCGLIATSMGVAQAQQAPAAAPPETLQPEAAAPDAQQAAPPDAQRPAQEGIEIPRRPGDLPGPIDSIHDLQDTAKLLFMMADQNRDGKISKQEAVDVGNLLVGGLFFAADADGDGAVSKEEADAVRDKLLKQNPVLRFVLQRAKQPNDPNVLAGDDLYDAIAGALDTNNDQKLQASELRQAVVTAVDTLFAVADTDQDGQLSPTELNAAVYGAVRAGLQASFQAADKDNSGSLSKEEFAQAIIEPAHILFDILDADLDGELTPEELDRAGRVIANELQKITIPQAENAPLELLRTGRRPEEVAPVPEIPVNPNAPAPAPRQ